MKTIKNLDLKQIVLILTKKSDKQLKLLIKSFEKFDLITQIGIMNNKNSLFHKMREKNKEIDKSTLALAAFYISIDEFVIKLNTINKNLIKFNNKNEKETKQEKLIQNWSIVKELKIGKNMSFRSIKKYFEKYHKLDFSYSLIYQNWKKIEGNFYEKNK